MYMCMCIYIYSYLYYIIFIDLFIYLSISIRDVPRVLMFAKHIFAGRCVTPALLLFATAGQLLRALLQRSNPAQLTTKHPNLLCNLVIIDLSFNRVAPNWIH